jgi:phage terminase small subunit
MGVLKNAKHEVFARFVAAGKSASEAYVKAGYPANRGNASRLKSYESIRRRIEEIMAPPTEIASASLATAAVSREWVLAGLRENADRCMQRKAVMHKGKLVQYAYEPAAANRAFELLGRELGMFVEQVRQDTNLRVIAGEPVTEADWEERYIRGRAAQVIEHGQAGGDRAPDGAEAVAGQGFGEGEGGDAGAGAGDPGEAQAGEAGQVTE